jgi:predicted transcriptional regulator
MTKATSPSNAMLHLTTKVVAAYVSNNPVPTQSVASLIADVHRAFETIITRRSHANNVAVRSDHVRAVRPAVPVSKSIHADYLVCLEDGKRFRSLKRHLRSHFGLSPEDYRRKWNLPLGYPMVAPGYSRERSVLAKEIGLGRRHERRQFKSPQLRACTQEGHQPRRNKSDPGLTTTQTMRNQEQNGKRSSTELMEK